VGDEVTLYYKGLLAQSGADAIFAHIGYGENWEDKTFIPMQRRTMSSRQPSRLIMPMTLI